MINKIKSSDANNYINTTIIGGGALAGVSGAIVKNNIDKKDVEKGLKAEFEKCSTQIKNNILEITNAQELNIKNTSLKNEFNNLANHCYKGLKKEKIKNFTLGILIGLASGIMTCIAKAKIKSSQKTK